MFHNKNTAIIDWNDSVSASDALQNHLTSLETKVWLEALTFCLDQRLYKLQMLKITKGNKGKKH